MLAMLGFVPYEAIDNIDKAEPIILQDTFHPDSANTSKQIVVSNFEYNYEISEDNMQVNPKEICFKNCNQQEYVIVRLENTSPKTEKELLVLIKPLTVAN